MTLNRGNLYLLLIVSCFAGYIWIFFNLTNAFADHQHDLEVCLIKNVTGIPCPSCGSTRAVLALIQGHFIESVLLNPFGLIIFLIMIVSPIWVAIDFYNKSDSLFIFYQRVEEILRNKKVMFAFFTLVIINWIWNIIKGL